MVYWYESALVTCLAAWGTTLSWPNTTSAGTQRLLAVGRFALPVGIAGSALWMMRSKDYYEEAVDKHAAWLVFHGALGASAASLTRLVFKAASPWRYVIQDIFVLWAYNLGYQMFPYIIKDQLQQTGQHQTVEKFGLDKREMMCKIVIAFGLAGLGYGAFILRVTKLGFRMSATRSWAHHITLATASTAFPGFIALVTTESSKRRTYDSSNFDPIDSYMRHMQTLL